MHFNKRTCLSFFVSLFFTFFFLVSAAVASPFLVTNGGFETGDFTGWTQSGNTGNTSVVNDPLYAHTGSYSAWFGPVGSLGYISQTLATTPGGQYLISFWLLDSGQPNELQVQWGGNTLFDQLNVPDQGYTLYSLLTTATSPSTTLTLGFQNDVSYFVLDDVSVSPVPEPATLSLFAAGLAGLGLVRRKLRKSV